MPIELATCPALFASIALSRIPAAIYFADKWHAVQTVSSLLKINYFYEHQMAANIANNIVSINNFYINETCKELCYFTGSIFFFKLMIFFVMILFLILILFKILFYFLFYILFNIK